MDVVLVPIGCVDFENTVVYKLVDACCVKCGKEGVVVSNGNYRFRCTFCNDGYWTPGVPGRSPMPFSL